MKSLKLGNKTPAKLTTTISKISGNSDKRLVDNPQDKISLATKKIIERMKSKIAEGQEYLATIKGYRNPDGSTKQAMKYGGYKPKYQTAGTKELQLFTPTFYQQYMEDQLSRLKDPADINPPSSFLEKSNVFSNKSCSSGKCKILDKPNDDTIDLYLKDLMLNKMMEEENKLKRNNRPLLPLPSLSTPSSSMPLNLPLPSPPPSPLSLPLLFPSTTPNLGSSKDAGWLGINTEDIATGNNANFTSTTNAGASGTTGAPFGMLKSNANLSTIPNTMEGFYKMLGYR
jgi:hypothetical protein